MSSATDWLDRTFYPDQSANWDDSLLRARILGRLAPESVVLDLGAGAGVVAQMNFRGVAGRVCGVDVDPRVTSNSHLDEGLVADGEAIPYPDNNFDLVFADNVLEHLAEPSRIFAEVARVLKPGGHFLFKTPNRWHYMPIIASLTPYSFHRYFNRLRGRREVDTFPTLYRANSRRAVARLAASAGLQIDALEFAEGRPQYLRVHPATYVAGLAYERLVNVTELLAGLRIVLIGTLRKPV
jgi:SAM-dependent methyltransferase